jgi:hypothetical protein
MLGAHLREQALAFLQELVHDLLARHHHQGIPRAFARILIAVGRGGAAEQRGGIRRRDLREVGLQVDVLVLTDFSRDLFDL